LRAGRALTATHATPCSRSWERTRCVFVRERLGGAHWSHLVNYS
jgi:hypothetical protein